MYASTLPIRVPALQHRAPEILLAAAFNTVVLLGREVSEGAQALLKASPELECLIDNDPNWHHSNVCATASDQLVHAPAQEYLGP